MHRAPSGVPFLKKKLDKLTYLRRNYQKQKSPSNKGQASHWSISKPLSIPAKAGISLKLMRATQHFMSEPLSAVTELVEVCGLDDPEAWGELAITDIFLKLF